MTVQERVHELLAPIVASLGMELLDVDYSGNALRLTIEETGGGVTSERLAEVNRLVSPILDQHDPISGRYTLEVSSPGLERPLKRAEHYRRAVGEKVAVKLVPEQQPRRIRGELLSVDPSSIVINAVEVDGVELEEPEQLTVELSTIAGARTVFDWGPGPKPGQPGAKNQPGAKKKALNKSKTPSQPRGVR
jgi:ribosome maturation factor RimP